ncbi:MAG: amidohydrolase [Oscillospiraceae bacterium]|nr:amidohydrolase [Oscillospiraceae bacterium]
MLIYNAKVHALDAASTIIESGFVEFDEQTGKITAVGDMSDCPKTDGGDYNANGAAVLPGFVDAHAHVGVWGNGEGIEGDDGNETTDPSTPHLRGIDMVNPADFCFTEAARAGITTVMCGPGSANPIGGQFLVMKTAGGSKSDIERRVIKAPAAMKFAFGENPKMVYRERSEAPVTRMATAAIIREQLFKARRYLEAIEKHEGDPESDLPEFDMKCEALLPVLRREIPVHAHAHRTDDIFTAMRIAREFDLRLTLLHATEAADIAGELAESGDIGVIIGPVLCDRSKPELAGHTITTAAKLESAGVLFAIATDHPVIPVQYLPLSAGLAIRGGLSKDIGLRAITADAARLCGVYERVGSLEVGKDADIVIMRGGAGEFYDVLTTPEAVFIDGRRVEV